MNKFVNKSAIDSATRVGDRLTFSIPSSLFENHLPSCAIDLGFSHGQRSCGFAASDRAKPEELHFGELVTRLQDWIKQAKGPECVLILEAPLSHAYHAPKRPTVRSGNPKQRAFECIGSYDNLRHRDDGKKNQSCPWYTGAGAGMSLAALRLLASIKDIPDKKTIHLFEGFHPQWSIPGCPAQVNDHGHVAEQLLRGYSSESITGQTKDGIHFSQNLAAMAGAQILKGQESCPPWIVFASAELFQRFKSPLQTNLH